jgi:hypothetical protein
VTSSGWQLKHYDYVIRSEEHLNTLQYIDNPQQWLLNENYWECGIAKRRAWNPPPHTLPSTENIGRFGK